MNAITIVKEILDKLDCYNNITEEDIFNVIYEETDDKYKLIDSFIDWCAYNDDILIRMDTDNIINYLKYNGYEVKLPE